MNKKNVFFFVCMGLYALCIVKKSHQIITT